MSDFDRRAFMKLLGLSATGALLPQGMLGCGDGPEIDPIRLAETGPQLEMRTPASLLAASREEFDLQLHVISGEVPRDIFGHAFTICAMPSGSGAPAFAGEGLMYRLDFGAARPSLRARLSKTPSWYVDEATRGSNNEFSTRGFVRMSSTWGVRNQANTAFLPMGDRIMATYDAGRPFEFDPESMKIITPVGAQSEWRSSLGEGLINGPFDLFFSTAHPVYDEHTGLFFTVNYRGGALGGQQDPFTDVMRWDGQGEMQRWTLVLDDGSPVEIKQSTHQIGVTQDYVVIMDTAFNIEAEQFGDPNFSAAQSPDTIIYVVSRDELKDDVSEVGARKLVIEREAAHFICDYDNPNQRITVHLAHGCASDASEWLREGDELAVSGGSVREDLIGAPTASTDISLMGRHVIDAEAGRVVDSKLTHDPTYTWAAALYTYQGSASQGRFEDLYWVSTGFSADLLTQRVYDLYKDYPYRTVPLDDLPFSGKANTLFRLSVTDMELADGYVFPAGRYGMSPQFVPREGSQSRTDGYLVCTVLSDDRSWQKSAGDEFWIFDAADLEQGPLCRLAHPRLNMPFTIHTAWMPEVRPRTSDYMVTARQDFADRLTDKPDDVKKVFEDEVYPQFGG
jgi:carotenoid cleavage dioxygenase-like enzyme